MAVFLKRVYLTMSERQFFAAIGVYFTYYSMYKPPEPLSFFGSMARYDRLSPQFAVFNNNRSLAVYLLETPRRTKRYTV